MSLYDDASLIMYPSGYKASKIYSLKPTDGTGDLTFSRASTATRVNESGLIESVAANVPRIDFTGGGCGSLLLEPQRTNTVLSNSDYTGSWSLVNVIPTANATTSPNGNNDAQKLTSANTFGQHYIRQIHGGNTVGAPHVFSCFAKAAELDILTLRLSNGGGPIVNFDLTNGTHDGGANGEMIDFGNGWYRCITYHPSAANQYLYPYIYTQVGNTQGDGVSGFYVYGSQLEEGSYETSLINTSGTTVTRVKDASTTGLSSLINSEEGVLFMEGTFGGGSFKFISLNSGSSTNRVAMYSPNGGQISYNVKNSGGNQFNGNIFLDATVNRKIALKYKANDFALWIDGVEVASKLSGSTFSASTLTSLSLHDGGGGSVFQGKVKPLIVFPTALTDTQLAELTTL